MTEDVIMPLAPEYGEITTGKKDVASAELSDSSKDLVVGREMVSNKIYAVPLRFDLLDQVKVLTSTVKISNTAEAIAFNKDIDYDNSIKRKEAIKLFEQLLDEGFITFQKIASVEHAIVLQAKIIAIQQEDI